MVRKNGVCPVQDTLYDGDWHVGFVKQVMGSKLPEAAFIKRKCPDISTHSVTGGGSPWLQVCIVNIFVRSILSAIKSHAQCVTQLPDSERFHQKNHDARIVSDMLIDRG